LSTQRHAGIAPVLRPAFVRAAITCLGLLLFWKLGMQDTHNLTKAAGFAVIANFGLAGLQLVLPWRRLVAWSALVLNGLVLLTAAIEGFLFWLYGLTPKHIVIADAIAGSNPEEAQEFVSLYWPQMLMVAALPLALTVLLAWIERRMARGELDAGQAGPRRGRVVGAALLTLFCALHLNPTMAEENPLVYWPEYILDYNAQRDFLDGVRHKVAHDLQAASRIKIDYVGPEQQTVVLVLGESVNRSNWSLYGYQRATTPRLDAHRDQMLVFRNAQSADAVTVQSLLKMLTPATREAPDAWLTEPNVLAMARRAGYRVYWLSNQEQGDGPIQILAEHAHEQVFVNNGRGRGTRSLDEQMLPHLDRILAAPAPKKLVVVHMQGAHLRYDLRYPQAFDRFSGLDDKVAAGLRAAGRPYWIRQARDQYDNAMLYGDFVLSAILERAQHAASTTPTSVLYVSDHGQEVGHNRDFAGHSSLDASGFTVPLLVWTSRSDKDEFLRNHQQRDVLEKRAYRTDVLDHTLYGLLDIRAAGYRPEYDLLSERFGMRTASTPAVASAQR